SSVSREGESHVAPDWVPLALLWTDCVWGRRKGGLKGKREGREEEVAVALTLGLV
ncbi:hypothetical protein RB213_009910, partial [Colletotrichum asianum]